MASRKPTGSRPPTLDKQAHKQRHAVECGINLLKQHRAVPYDATIHVAAINIWLRYLERHL